MYVSSILRSLIVRCIHSSLGQRSFTERSFTERSAFVYHAFIVQYVSIFACSELIRLPCVQAFVYTCFQRSYMGLTKFTLFGTDDVIYKNRIMYFNPYEARVRFRLAESQFRQEMPKRVDEIKNLACVSFSSTRSLSSFFVPYTCITLGS